ncbi:MAG: phosphatase PAP2 family protein [Rhodoferax sp.]
MAFDPPDLQFFWRLLTRLGEMQILLPAALLVMLALSRRPDARALAFRWLACLALAALATLASKVAFIGWGLGSAAHDFTGISGHAMFAAAVYPILLGALAARWPPPAQRIALAGGFALALAVGFSRLQVGAHSNSEVLAGLLLGGAASLTAIAGASLPRLALGSSLSALVVVWVLLSPVHIPPLPTHSAVTLLALTLSGHAAPYTRRGTNH